MKKTMTMTPRSGGTTIKKAEPKKAPPSDPPKERPYTKAELEKMNMADLRKIGDPLGAKDTSRIELIEEILTAQTKGENRGGS